MNPEDVELRVSTDSLKARLRIARQLDRELSDANHRWCLAKEQQEAAESEVKGLRERVEQLEGALRGAAALIRKLAMFVDQDRTRRVDGLAEWFYAETGVMAPGKDVPMEMSTSQPSQPERSRQYWVWHDGTLGELWLSAMETLEATPAALQVPQPSAPMPGHQMDAPGGPRFPEEKCPHCGDCVCGFCQYSRERHRGHAWCCLTWLEELDSQVPKVPADTVGKGGNP